MSEDLTIKTWRDNEHCGIRFSMFLPDFRVAAVRLDRIDRALIFEQLPGDKESKTPLADQLQRLQTLVFRIEQQEYEKRRKKSDDTPP